MKYSLNLRLPIKKRLGAFWLLSCLILMKRNENRPLRSSWLVFSLKNKGARRKEFASDRWVDLNGTQINSSFHLLVGSGERRRWKEYFIVLWLSPFSLVGSKNIELGLIFIWTFFLSDWSMFLGESLSLSFFFLKISFCFPLISSCFDTCCLLRLFLISES